MTEIKTCALPVLIRTFDGEIGTVIVDETPFYATMGGQQGDKGVITTASMQRNFVACLDHTARHLTDVSDFTAKQLDRIFHEKMVNEKIAENIAVDTQVMTMDEAKKTGASCVKFTLDRVIILKYIVPRKRLDAAHSWV